MLFTPFFYNKRKLKTFLEDGHKPHDKKAEDYFRQALDQLPQGAKSSDTIALMKLIQRNLEKAQLQSKE